MSRIRLVYLSTVCYGTYETNVKKNCTEAMNWYRLNELKKWLIQKILLLDWPTCNSLAFNHKTSQPPTFHQCIRPPAAGCSRAGRRAVTCRWSWRAAACPPTRFGPGDTRSGSCSPCYPSHQSSPSTEKVFMISTFSYIFYCNPLPLFILTSGEEF